MKSLIVGVLVTSPRFVENTRLELENPVDKTPPLVEKVIEVELRKGAAFVERAMLELSFVSTKVEVRSRDDEVEFKNGALVDEGIELVETSPPFVDSPVPVAK